MAHFAEIVDGIVQRVVVVANDALGGAEFPASEPLGQALLAESGIAGDFKQCSYSGSFRGCYPGIGWRYDAAADEFAAPVVQAPQP